MISTNTPPVVYTGTEEALHVTTTHRTVSWAAIFAGAVAGLGTHLLLTMLGIAIGAGMVDPVTDENPIGAFSLGSAIAWSVSALIALWTGGWVAGRFMRYPSRSSGRLHGFLVWALATVTTVVLLSTGTASAIGGAAKMVGQGIAAAGKPAAGGLADLAKNAVQQNSTTVSSFLDEALQSRGAQTGAAAVRAKREVGFALTRLFAPGQDVQNPENRAAVVRALVEHAGMSEAAANQALSSWTTSYQSLQADLDAAKQAAEEKARVAAERAASALSKAALLSAIAFALGALVATLGGARGARSVSREATV